MWHGKSIPGLTFTRMKSALDEELLVRLLVELEASVRLPGGSAREGGSRHTTASSATSRTNASRANSCRAPRL